MTPSLPRAGDAAIPPSVSGPVPLTLVLTAAMGMASFPIFAMAALGPLVVGELELSRTTFGAVSTTMFGTAFVGSVFIGRLVDLVGARRILVGLFTCSTIAVLLLATADSFVRLLAAGVIVGIAQASANPATNSVVSHHVRAERRGTLMGVKQAGVPLAQFVAGGVLAPLAVLVGWRVAVLLGLALIVPSLVATLVVLPAGVPVAGEASAPAPARAFGVPRSLGWLFVCTFLLATSLQAANVYLPLYAFEVVGTSASAAGVLVGAVGVVGMTARISLGGLAGRTARPVRIVAIIAALATGAVLAIIGAAAGSVLLLWTGAMVFGASVLGVNVVGMTVMVRSVDAANAGRATGALSTVMFAGFALGPVGFGSLVDASESYVFAWSVVLAMCAAAAVIGATVWSRGPREALAC